MPADQQKKQACLALSFCGELCELHSDGSLYLPSYRTLVVSDLHFEKGNAQSAGAPLPRYDTDVTLSKLEKAISRTDPQTCIFLGDSFHNADVARTLPAVYREALDKLARNRDFIWIEGNHDPDLPVFLPGRAAPEYFVNGLHFFHQLTSSTIRKKGQVTGHYHPKARVNLKLRRISAPCFIHDGSRLILPAFGAFTGGLNVLDKAIQSVLKKPQSAFLCHAENIYHLPVSDSFFVRF